MVVWGACPCGSGSLWFSLLIVSLPRWFIFIVYTSPFIPPRLYLPVYTSPSIPSRVFSFPVLFALFAPHIEFSCTGTGRWVGDCRESSVAERRVFFTGIQVARGIGAIQQMEFRELSTGGLSSPIVVGAGLAAER